MTFIKPIYDRTIKDVEHVLELKAKGWENFSADEKAEWMRGLKGSLNYSDLNRIENNIQFLSDLFGLGLSTSYGKIPEMPNQSYFDKMLSNVSAIRTGCPIYTDTPNVPSTVNGFDDINAIEKILYDVDYHYESQWRIYGNEMLAGEPFGGIYIK